MFGQKFHFAADPAHVGIKYTEAVHKLVKKVRKLNQENDSVILADANALAKFTLVPYSQGYNTKYPKSMLTEGVLP